MAIAALPKTFRISELANAAKNCKELSQKQKERPQGKPSSSN